MILAEKERSGEEDMQPYGRELAVRPFTVQSSSFVTVFEADDRK